MRHQGNNVQLPGSIANKIKYNGKELQDELQFNVYDYGARKYDPVIGRWFNTDPLAEKYYDFSPFSYGINNPVNMIDADGNFIVSAEFAKKYPKITAYLKNNVKSDILSSDLIVQALYDVTPNSTTGKGNLTKEVLATALTWGQGPRIMSAKKPNGGFMVATPDGHYDDRTNTISLAEHRLVALEKMLSGDTDQIDKTAALLGVFMTLVHEMAHFGDYLDGIQELGREVGRDLDWQVWWSNDEGNEYLYPLEMDKYNSNTQKAVIDEKRKHNAIPTLPEYPGSAGSADDAKKTPNPKNRKN